jgi:hypothetical protein
MKLREEISLSVVMHIVSMFGDPHVLYLKHQVSGGHRMSVWKVW